MQQNLRSSLQTASPEHQLHLMSLQEIREERPDQSEANPAYFWLTPDGRKMK